jgi:hypothetical protein
MQAQLRLVDDGETVPVAGVRHPSWCEQDRCTTDRLERSHVGIAEQFMLAGPQSHTVITLQPERHDTDRLNEIGIPYVILTVHDVDLVDVTVEIGLDSAELEMLIGAAQRQLRLLDDASRVVADERVAVTDCQRRWVALVQADSPYRHRELGGDVLVRDVPEGRHCAPTEGFVLEDWDDDDDL